MRTVHDHSEDGESHYGEHANWSNCFASRIQHIVVVVLVCGLIYLEQLVSKALLISRMSPEIVDNHFNVSVLVTGTFVSADHHLIVIYTRTLSTASLRGL